MELGLQAFGQLLDRTRLGQPGGALDEHVAVGEQGDQQALDQAFLTQNLGGKELSQRDYRFTVIHRLACS